MGHHSSSNGSRYTCEQFILTVATAVVADGGSCLDGALLQLDERNSRLSLQSLVNIGNWILLISETTRRNRIQRLFTVRLMMLVMMELHGILVDVRLKSIVRVRQGRERVRSLSVSLFRLFSTPMLGQRMHRIATHRRRKAGGTQSDCSREGGRDGLTAGEAHLDSTPQRERSNTALRSERLHLARRKCRHLQTLSRDKDRRDQQHACPSRDRGSHNRVSFVGALCRRPPNLNNLTI